jgi:putative endonuclease
LASSKNGTVYTGHTNNLLARVHEHKTKQFEGFTKDHNVTKLVWYDQTTDVRIAIKKEKQIKKWIVYGNFN